MILVMNVCIMDMAATQVCAMLDAMGLDIAALSEMMDACAGIRSISDNTQEFEDIIQLQINSIVKDAKTVSKQAAYITSIISDTFISTFEQENQNYIAVKVTDMIKPIHYLCGIVNRMHKKLSSNFTQKTGVELCIALRELGVLYSNPEISEIAKNNGIKSLVTHVVHAYYKNYPHSGNDHTDSVISSNSTVVAQPAPPNNREFSGSGPINYAARNTQFTPGMLQILNDSQLQNIQLWRFTCKKKDDRLWYPNPQIMMDKCKNSENSMYTYKVTEANVVTNISNSTGMNLGDLVRRYLYGWMHFYSCTPNQADPGLQNLVINNHKVLGSQIQPFRLVQCGDDNSLTRITMLMRINIRNGFIQFDCMVPTSMTHARLGCAICGKKLLFPAC